MGNIAVVDGKDDIAVNSIFNPLNHPIILTDPARFVLSAWIGHVPFGMYLIDVLRPKVIVELGTHFGDSYCAFCQAVSELDLETRCYAIDSWKGDSHSGYYGPEILADLQSHHDPRYGGFSRLIQTTFDDALGYFEDHAIDLLHIDGLHTYEAVKQDFEKWLPKLSDRGIILFHDINVRELDFEVWKFWEEVRQEFLHFEFFHSHGLGVLGVGKHCPDVLKSLFQSSEEEAAKVRQLFSQLGERLELAHELQIIRTASQQDEELQSQENARGLQEKGTLIHQQNLEAISLNEKLKADERLLAEKDARIKQEQLETQAFDEKLKASDRLREETAHQLKSSQDLLANARMQCGSYSSTLNQQTNQTADKSVLIADLEAQLSCYSAELKHLRAQISDHRPVDSNQSSLWSNLKAFVRPQVTTEASLPDENRAVDGPPDQRFYGRTGLVAFPLQVPVVRDVGVTEVTWETGDDSEGDVCVSVNGEPESLFATGRQGSQRAEWISPGATYEFRLYGSAPQKLLLDKVTVVGLSMQRAVSRDVLRGFLDPPVEDLSAPYLEVSGWAYSTEGSISWVEAFLENVPLGLLRYGEQRPDAETELPAGAPPDCGFSGKFQLDAFLMRPPAVRVRVADEGGNIRDLIQGETEANLSTVDPAYDYARWVKLFDTLSDEDVEAILAGIDRLQYKPLITIVMPVYNVAEIWLRKAIESVRRQLYPNWELCIADDNSTAPHVRRVLDEYAGKDQRIKIVYRTTNGHISAASNSALELATGEFIALLDNDDELPKHALYAVVATLNEHPEADLIYSDEDKIDEKGQRREPHFKSDWNPDLFYSCNMISHLGVYRSKILKRIGGFREGYEGSQDYDLALRFIEQIPEDHIHHIPRVLYHWRAIAGSVALASGEKDYAHEAARRAIRSHLERKGVKATVTEGNNLFHRVIYPVPDPAPLVSMVIATRDCFELLSQTVDGLLNETDYDPLEIIIVDNQSTNPATLKYLRELQRDKRVKVLEYDAPFNYSAINNLGVRESSGELIGLINNDIKVISPGWLKEMVSHAVRPGIGAVGAKLLYPDDTVQHAGVILGVNGVAAHAHRLISKESPGYIGRAAVIQNLSAVTGACMILRRKIFADIGGLDEVNLTVAFNDTDLCIRIRKRGYRIVWTPYAELYHLESASRGRDDTPENAPRFIKEIEYMMHGWDEVLKSDPYYNPNLTMVREDFSLAVPPRITRKW